MSVEEPSQKAKSDIWGRRQLEAELASGEVITSAAAEPFTHEDVEYLCNNVYPFIQLANATITPSDLEDLKFKSIFDKNSGWTIFDYGPLMSTSAPTLGAKHRAENEDEEGGEGGGGYGTVVNQQFNVAEAMVNLIAEKGWSAVALISGSDLMQLYFVLIARERNIELVDFRIQDSEIDRVHKKVAETLKERMAKVAPVLVT